VGAQIVSKDNEPLGWGYNGPPKILNDDEINWDRPEKYDWIHHAEYNAIRYSKGDLEGATIYVIGCPCKKCMLDIIGEGIKRVVWFRQRTDGTSVVDPDPRSFEIARAAGVSVEEFTGNLHWMRDRMQQMEEMGVFE